MDYPDVQRFAMVLDGPRKGDVVAVPKQGRTVNLMYGIGWLGDASLAQITYHVHTAHVGNRTYRLLSQSSLPTNEQFADAVGLLIDSNPRDCEQARVN